MYRVGIGLEMVFKGVSLVPRMEHILVYGLDTQQYVHALSLNQSVLQSLRGNLSNISHSNSNSTGHKATKEQFAGAGG